MAAIITNRPNTVEIEFNELAAAFGSARQTLEKGAGSRLDLAVDKTYIELIMAPEGRKIQITGDAYLSFRDKHGGTFIDMEALYLSVSAMMEDRTGA